MSACGKRVPRDRLKAVCTWVDSSRKLSFGEWKSAGKYKRTLILKI
jgi:hypothetical protein